MSQKAPPRDTENQSRGSSGRGRGRSRGGVGKYLRARGRGRGAGRPAVFTERLLLDGEANVELTEEEAAEVEREKREKYGRRKLGTNADRYKEEVELDSDGEPIVEPEVDLSAFLAKQRLSDDVDGPAYNNALKEKDDDEDDVDTSLAHIFTRQPLSLSKKGKVQQIEWDETLEELHREKQAADAARDLKERFKAKSDNLRSKPVTSTSSSTRRNPHLKEAPALPLPEGVKPKTQMEEMESFLDELLG